MNKQDLQGAFSKLQAPDDLLGDVISLQSEKKVRPSGWKTVRRAAACAAAVAILVTALAIWPTESGTETPNIIAMPGIIQAIACEVEDQDNGIVGVDPGLNIGANTNQNMIQFPYMNGTDGLGVMLKVEEEVLQDYQISFDISCDYGTLYMREKVPLSGLAAYGFTMVSHGQSLTIQNGERYYWRFTEQRDILSGATNPFPLIWVQGEGIYTQVIIRADGNIVGYAVFEMIRMDEIMQFFGIAMRQSVYYPQVNGQFQPVTEEYVQQQIQALDLPSLAGSELAYGGVYHSARSASESIDVPFLSVCHGIRYTCHVFDQRYADREITFDICMNGGRIRVGKQYFTESCSLGNDTVFFWDDYPDGSLAIQNDGAVYVDVIIRSDGDVIGYAVIKIGRMYSCDPETGERGDAIGYAADSCYSMVYPPEDDRLATLTEEQAREMIEAYKQKCKADE